MKTNLRFFANGIKVGTGKLQKAFASIQTEGNQYQVAGTISVYARDYKRLSAEIGAAFAVKNDSDSMTDYFEQDSFKVVPTHPLYDAVKVGMIDSRVERYAKKEAKKAEKLATLLRMFPVPTGIAVYKAAQVAKQADLKAKGEECAAIYIKLYGKPAAPVVEPVEASYADFYK